jgi:hypothetical protein
VEYSESILKKRDSLGMEKTNYLEEHDMGGIKEYVRQKPGRNSLGFNQVLVPNSNDIYLRHLKPCSTKRQSFYANSMGHENQLVAMSILQTTKKME